MPSVRYAQHFLVDQSAVHKIVYALNLSQNDQILEIGPGMGALTSELIKKAAHVTAVEIDGVLVKELERRFASNQNFTLFQNDILKFDLRSLTTENPGAGRYKIVGNLPYNLTSPILRRLSFWNEWSMGCIMVQKEVGDRLCADVGTSDYGALTVGMNLTCELEKVFDLSPGAFKPPPKIKSSVVKITRRPVPLTDNIKGTQRVIQAAFQQRRKTILNSLSHGLTLSKDRVRTILAMSGVMESQRPEQISVDHFVALSKMFERQNDKP